MKWADLQAQALVFARPGSSKSPVVATNLLTWANQFLLQPLYKLRRWWFLTQQQTFVLGSGTSVYTLQGGLSALYLTSGTWGTVDLLLPPLAQATAFYASSGPPEALALTVPAAPASPTAVAVTQFQVFPTPDAKGPYSLVVGFTSPFADLILPTDHNFLTDQFPMLVLGGLNAMVGLALHEDAYFAHWFDIYRNQVIALATYDHEVRRGTVMNEPIEPFVPTFGALAGGPAPQPAGAAAGGV